MDNRPRLSSLTSARFFAAAAVVVAHFGLGRAFESEVLKNWLALSWQAVTFFFVLSGFIMAYSYGRLGTPNLSVSPRIFWLARAARILPAYYVALLIALPTFVYGTLFGRSPSPDLLVPGLFLVPLLLQSWIPPYALLWNVPAWSLSVEWFFYLIFPWLWKSVAARSNKSLLVLSCSLILITAAVRMNPLGVEGAVNSPWRPNFLAYFPFFHLPSFFLGVVFGLIFIRGGRLPPTIGALTFWIAWILMLGFTGMQAWLPRWTANDATMTVVFGALIFGAASAGPGRLNLLNRPIAVLLGNISYAIYILHIPLLWWWNVVVHRWLGVEISIIVDFAVYFGLVILISLLVHFLIERPMRKEIVDRFASRIFRQTAC